jgi:hypothetical protein
MPSAINPFPGWLGEVAEDKVHVWPDSIDAEARCNCWSFALSPEQAACVSVIDVCDFAAGVTAGRRAGLAARGAGPMTCYWWHDAQAGQLRFSLVSTAHGRLPFGTTVAAAPSLAAVASDWLGSPQLHGIPRDELRMLAEGEQCPNGLHSEVQVWSEMLG